MPENFREGTLCGGIERLVAPGAEWGEIQLGLPMRKKRRRFPSVTIRLTTFKAKLSTAACAM
jgi:hypothetical protein